MSHETKPEAHLDDTIDELAERVKKTTDSLAARAHHLASEASTEARALAERTIVKLRAASAKLEELARKLEASRRS
jgi:hypothetical protein